MCHPLECLPSICESLHCRGGKWSYILLAGCDVITCQWGKLEWLVIVLVTGGGDSSAQAPNSGLFIQSPRILAFPSITVWGYDYILTIIFIPQFREVIPAQLVESRSARLQRLCSMTMRNNAYFTVWRLEPTDGSAPGGWAYYDHYRTKLTA